MSLDLVVERVAEGPTLRSRRTLPRDSKTRKIGGYQRQLSQLRLRLFLFLSLTRVRTA